MEEQNRSSEHKTFDKEEKSPTFDFVKQESLHILHVDDDVSFLKTLDEWGETENSLELALAQISGAVDITSSLKDYRKLT